MVRRTILKGLFFLSLVVVAVTGAGSQARAGGIGEPYDWGRFYYYPYVYYPHNFSAPVQFDNLYYRYPQERQIPVYNRAGTISISANNRGRQPVVPARREPATLAAAIRTTKAPTSSWTSSNPIGG